MHRLLLYVHTPAALFHCPPLVQALQNAGFGLGIQCPDGIFSSTAIQTMTGLPPATSEEGYLAAISPYGSYCGNLPLISLAAPLDFPCGMCGSLPLGTAEQYTEAALTFVTPQDYAGVSLLLTCGPTIEDADPARYVSNRSTGKMGTAIARQAARRGAQVFLIHGPMQASVPQHPNIRPIAVRSASQMLQAVDDILPHAEIAILCAAVADFSPLAYSEEKIKKGSSPFFTLRMKKNPDILAHIGSLAKRPYLVGFAAESNNLSANAQEKMERKHCDILCANDITAPNCGFGTATNSLTVFLRNQPEILIPLADKNQVANSLLNIISVQRKTN